MNTTAKKITLTPVKNFINKNEHDLYVNVISVFDGMYDCVSYRNDGFKKVSRTPNFHPESSYYEATLGFEGVWFVRGSRDYFNSYNENGFTGFEVSNSCGMFIVAIKK
jgi:hypothetical protein